MVSPTFRTQQRAKREAYVHQASRASMKYEFYWPVIWQYRGLLLDGFAITMMLFLTGTISSIVLGTFVGVAGASQSRWARVIGELYVEINRNTPLVVKLFLLYFGCGLDAYPAAIVGLAIHHSAYVGEIVRAGIQSIPRGQMEAGLSTGMSRFKVARYVILPQAFVIIIPPITTQILEVLKNSSIAMTIAIPELTFQTQQIEATTFRGFEAATVATLAYLAVAGVIALGAFAIERALIRRRQHVVRLVLLPATLGEP
jgi:polar amino acid transport system permease protein